MALLNHLRLPQALGRSLLVAGLTFGIAGCATLPRSGPSGAQIEKDLTVPTMVDGIRVVLVDQPDVLPVPQPLPASPFRDGSPAPTDMVGPGDVLEITVYEAGVTLFGGSGDKVSAQQPGFDPSVKAETFPSVRVNDDGTITLPYAGKLHVAGMTTVAVQALIKHSLNGFSQDPQIIVAIRQPITNTVIVGGEVIHPGRLVLQTNRESLSDVLALAGGYHGEAKDLTVRLSRQDTQAEYRVAHLVNGQSADPLVRPGDKIQVLSQPYSYSVMGAAGKVALLPFATADVTLAEAISQAGGADPHFGDAEAIFVFRMEQGAAGSVQPTVYHFNMMHPSGFFLARRFQIHDKDVVYFGNARANQTDKLLQLISELFTPLITVISAAQVLRN